MMIRHHTQNTLMPPGMFLCSRKKLQKKNSVHIISQIFQPMWMKIGMLPQPVGLSKLMSNLFHMTNIKEKRTLLMWVLIHMIMSNIWIYVMNHVCRAGQQSSCMAKALMFDIVHIFRPNLFIPVMLIGTIDFYYFIPLTDLDLAWVSQDQCKAKPLGFIFSYTFQLIRMKFIIVLKQFKLNILILLLSEM